MDSACVLATLLIRKQGLTLPTYVDRVRQHLQGISFASVQARLCAVLQPLGRGVQVLGYAGKDKGLSVGDQILSVNDVMLVNFPLAVSRLFLRGGATDSQCLVVVRDDAKMQIDVPLESETEDFGQRLRIALKHSNEVKLLAAARSALSREVAKALAQAYGCRENRRTYAPNKFRYRLEL